MTDHPHPNTHHKPLVEGDVGAHLRRLAGPVAGGLLAISSFSVVDTFYISRLGTAALAALGFTMPVVTFFLSLIFGMMVGTTSVLSRVYGEGDIARVRRLGTDSLVLTFLIIACAATAGYFSIDRIFRLMGATPDIMPMIHEFMTVWYVGMVFAGLMLMSNACLRSNGNTRFPSMMMTLVAVLNTMIDPFLIYGWWGAPRLGLAGAAWTLVISHAIAGGIAFYHLAFRVKLLDPRVFHAGFLASWGRLLHVGIPSILTNQVQPLSIAVVTGIAAGMGQAAVAALGVVGRIEGLAVLLFYALGMGASIFTGQNFGAGNYGRVREVIVVAGKYAVFWSLGVAVTCFAFADEIPLIFDNHAEVVRDTALYLCLVPMSYIGMGAAVIANGSMNAQGRPLIATLPILLRSFFLYVPLAYALAAHMGFAGILFAMSISNILVGVIALLCNKAVMPRA